MFGRHCDFLPPKTSVTFQIYIYIYLFIWENETCDSLSWYALQINSLQDFWPSRTWRDIREWQFEFFFQNIWIQGYWPLLHPSWLNRQTITVFWLWTWRWFLLQGCLARVEIDVVVYKLPLDCLLIDCPVSWIWKWTPLLGVNEDSHFFFPVDSIVDSYLEKNASYGMGFWGIEVLDILKVESFLIFLIKQFS